MSQRGFKPAHFVLRELRWTTEESSWMANSLALLCRTAPTMAVVFIHGFGGGAGKTWERFPKFLRSMPEATATDAFFLDYPSTTNSIGFCSSIIRGFLLDLLREPAKILNPSLPQKAERCSASVDYQKIVLVGHSMGAVVARRALLDLDRDKLKEADRAKLRMLFFAPAHKGARSLGKLIATGLGFELFGLAVGALLGDALRLRYRSVDDLIKKSDFLSTLAAHSQARREDRVRENQGIDFLRAHVYHAQNDYIVYDDAFDDDNPMHPVIAQGHSGVCKPSADYPKPAEALAKLLRP